MKVETDEVGTFDGDGEGVPTGGGENPSSVVERGRVGDDGVVVLE